MTAPSRLSLMFACAALALLGACGEQEGGGANVTAQMKDLEVVDGSTSDAMTDLDGVTSEGTAMADTGSGNTTAPNPVATNASAPVSTDEAEDKNAEVVADQ